MTEARARLAGWRARLAEPRDAPALVAFRIALGVIVTVSALRFLGYGWIDECFVAPKFHFRYWGFAWLPVPPPALTYGLFVLMAVLGVLVAAGLFFRAAVGLLFLVFTYLQLVDVATYLNHYYLVSLLAGLLFFIPVHRAWSLDARRRPQIRTEALPAWCTILLRFQVAVVYVNAGLAKATADWLLSAQPLNIWLSARTSLPVVGPYLDLPAVAYLAAWAGFLFDTTIVLFLLWRRTRAVAYLAVIGFHLSTRILFPPIGMFPVIMVVAALVFFDASWPRRLAAGWARMRALRPAPATGAAPVRLAAVGAPLRRAPLVLAGAFMLAQVVLPLRSHVYGGNVLWHEQGMRFSWRVMAREKNGSVTFVVREPATGREWHVPPARYLTRVQEREMAVQPDLILQLAHRIARDFEAAGHGQVEVHADALVSLNGRRAAVFVDPRADLAREADGVGAKPWILPAPQESPPRLRPLRVRSL